MPAFIQLIYDVLSINISLGSVSMNLAQLFSLVFIFKIFYSRISDWFFWHERDETFAGSRGFDSYKDMNDYDNYMNSHSTDGSWYMDGDKYGGK